MIKSKITPIGKTMMSVALSGVLLTSAALAGTEDSKTVTAPIVAPAPETSAITGDAGVAFVSKYFSRGIQLENQGVIGQPYADLYIKLFDGTGFINSVTLNLSIWSSIDSHKQTPEPRNLGNWYEFDYTPGIAVTFLKSFTLTASYFEFDSPSNSFGAARSSNLALSYDDSSMLGAFALHPHVTWLHEFGAPGFAGLAANGNYFEVGVAPSYAFNAKATYPVTVSLPITVGLGDDKFYAGETYGYTAVAPTVAVGLGCIPSKYGSWTSTSSVTYYNLGSTTKAADVGHSDDFVFSTAIGVTF